MTQPATSNTNTRPETSISILNCLLILIFRLLLLGVGSGLAVIFGIVVANAYPNPNPEKPLILKLLEHLDNKGESTFFNFSSIREPTEANPLKQLTPVQRVQLKAQLSELDKRMKRLSEDVTMLETQLGTSGGNESLERRIQAITLLLKEPSTPSSNAPLVGNSNGNRLAALAADKLKVTLPSDILFEESKSTLRPEAGLILDKIVTDLQAYPSSTIRIAIHTDNPREAKENRNLSFERAKAVQQYLSSALDDSYRWLIIGYGETRPLVANDTEVNQQRNRRVEIAVD
ncbi:MAG: OmpA family protein [Moorea sp. SIO1G6]|uniref:Peptidoglycan-associated lipoprotein n=1 Tax=Moorena producens 3L TaxID=489825 RepID=F4XPX4_9CYAN|nr:peptidoglycan-associated lipoprotein [Moorena producens 3L]NEP35724.1 OmpA family protein [Moorena sp. SIO3B2]NEP66435.1 OmpA family protein [Moorena sp. SIO3A5]NEQ06126.1 OmpA family protein [Moorena sp. SIO4E2]NEQ13761.1 OmpA family protein [Moorena sp. SIO3E2]NER90120.1 OmpA family protein [Moorena sp. SIO3A2]NES44099.1 OmpA family protein [Moorena sp. SIO2C4]NES83986.1 OmpA family protein [Moorena sp. SIO2B7]NET66341.1 OmpA family protein [Moorena sp. SIO1G6]